jgi:SAM-dependent methyltransferase
MDVLHDLAERAQAEHFWYHGFRSYVVPMLRDLAAGRPGLRLIDCGCGTAHNLDLLHPYGHAVGFDPSAAALTHARRRGCAVVRADGRHAPFPDGRFDIATSFDVMQCVDDDGALVREMARLVRPGGAVVISMAAFEALRGDHSELWQEVRRYTPAMARQLAEQAGLRVERMQLMFGSLVPLMFTVRLAQRLTRPFRGVRHDDIDVPSAPVNAVLTALVRGEAAVGRRVPLPIGSSILLLARKPDQNRTRPPK